MTLANDTSAVFEAVRTLATPIADRREEIERVRRLPPDVLDELLTAGCFRMLVPRSHGGIELELPAYLQAIEELARADGSVGWTVMIGSMAPVLFGKLPRTTFDALYVNGPDVIGGGAFNPTGMATPTDGGFRVTGQWAFASGCDHCHWFLAHCIVDDGREPPMRMMVLPRADVEIKDTWSVSGLRGTGSHDFVVNDVFVPDERTFSLFGVPNLDIPLLRIPELSFSTLAFSAVALGIAQGAVDEITDLAVDKVPAFGHETLVSNPLFRHQLGEADARLRAARALVYTEAEAAWATVVARAPFTPEHRARIRGTATWATWAAASIVDTAYSAGGGSAIYARSPLQHRLRDVHTLTQHFTLKRDTYTTVGAVLAGQDVDLTFL